MQIDYAKEPKVLVVDDIEVHRFLLQAGLERINPFAKIDEAASGAEAKDKLSNNRYDIVVCDWVMPDISGADLLRWMRARPCFNKTPFVMISGKDDNQDIIEAFTDLHVDDYVVKPFTAEDVYRKIQKLLEKKR